MYMPRRRGPRAPCVNLTKTIKSILAMSRYHAVRRGAAEITCTDSTWGRGKANAPRHSSRCSRKRRRSSTCSCSTPPRHGLRGCSAEFRLAVGCRISYCFRRDAVNCRVIFGKVITQLRPYRPATNPEKEYKRVHPQEFQWRRHW